jgi:Tfp pilus assembly PilM family ATPase
MSGSYSIDDAKPSIGQSMPSGAIPCGACGGSNPAEAQFCAGCGHALYEPCVGCSKPVALSQSFCGSCGCDLVAAVKKKVGELESKITSAIQSAKERDFERARILLDTVLREKDYRFREIVSHARTVRDKIDAVAEQESETASERIEAAIAAYESANHAGVVELLGNLAPKLLTPKAAEILAQSKTLLEQLGDSQATLQEAFQKRDWATSGAILDRMLTLQPDDESVARLALKVGKKLVSKAQTLREGHKYRAAANLLDCVPSNARDDAYIALHDHIESIRWLSEQFAGEPFATPTLGRLAKSWLERSEGDPQALAVLKRLSKHIKEPKASSRELYPWFESATHSWIGGRVGMLAYPESVAAEQLPESRSAPGQFNVAIGLALQGLGLTRINEDFTTKKGLLSRLGRKKATGCWGIDIGASGLKSVYLKLDEDGQPRLRRCAYQPFETVLTRSVSDEKADEIIRAAVASFVEKNDTQNEPVWVSFPSRELVSRFVKLPPVNDKQAVQLFDREIESRIPLPLDEVVCVRSMAALPDDELATIGRPAFVSAAKKQFIERYLGGLQEAGLTVSGLQAPPIALANLVAFEFAEVLRFEGLEEDARDIKLPTVALADCGAETTTLLFVSSHSCWFWSFESGGEDFTRLIARTTQRTHAEAEKIKRDLSTLERPDTQYQPVEQKMEEMHGRVSKLILDTLNEHKEFDLRQTWCCGGGVRTHGWIRRILCKR